MSNRTIIEINHDFWDRIAGAPEEFGDIIVEYTRACDPKVRERLRDFGVKVLGTVHHTDEVTISFGKRT